ncbi:hypothetical protein [Streptomyces spirodelae]|uniref:Uncharacterized protein n=1 Tax=Streptomyces spirodelae TaxID=2812904 RepID=A0ABS3X1G1_9ACTN|nr:hypothetical protein [Streptomyces spirodelae]MBO8189197.1 hypothetical protein [Streptomyces spirodelae]
MGMGTEDNSLAVMAHQVDESDGVCVEVVLMVGGAQLRGRLVSEVRYRELMADTVRRGNAAPAAASFDLLTKEAEERRADRQHLRETRPDAPLEAPRFLYLVEDPDWARAWCVPLSSVDAWSMTALTVDLPDA